MTKDQKTNIAVLLIDMQEIFLETINPLNRALLVYEQQKVLDYCIEQNVPVITLEFYDCGDTVNPLKRKTSVNPYHKLIVKSKDDGFTDTDLENQLGEMKVEDLLLMGVNASGCVLKTANEAISREFNVHICTNLIANKYDKPITDNIMNWYNKNTTVYENPMDFFKQ